LHLINITYTLSSEIIFLVLLLCTVAILTAFCVCFDVCLLRLINITYIHTYEKNDGFVEVVEYCGRSTMI